MTKQLEFFDISFVKKIIRRIFPNSQAVGLAIIILVSSVLIITLSDLLMPVFASVVLAYLLDGLVTKSVHYKVPRLPAVYLVFFGFLACLGFLIFVLLPMLSEKAVELVQHIPEIIKRAQKEIMRLPEMYPQFISESRIREIVLAVQRELLTYGQNALSFASVIGLVTALVYLFLVPMMVFFFLKDKETLMIWLEQFLPRERHLSQSVWREIDMQLGNYVRGKFAEVIILMAVSYITFSAMGLNYSILLSVLMGLSVIIPYVGATLVTFPVLGIAYFQWGLSGDEFMYIVIAYSVIQALDGVVLVPLLFSEAVNLHPIAIIVAILFFGGLWGFWGVFFAIPLATVVKAVLTAWPRIGETGPDTIY